MDLAILAEASVNGVLIGFLYALIAIPIVLIYKTSSVPNLAEGALIMVGAYAVYWIKNQLGVSILATILVSFPLMFALGLLIERIILRRLGGQPIIMLLMATLGIDIILRGFTLTVGGATAKSLDLGLPNSPIIIGDALISPIYLIGAIVSVFIFIIITIFFKSRRGVKLRAISDDYIASWAVGIGVEQGIALSWGLAAVVSTVAGVFFGSIYSVDQTLASLILKGLTVAVLGGLDSLVGALVAGILLGVVENLGVNILDPLLGGGTRDLLVAAVLIIAILIRPYGLFGREHIERI